MKKGYGVFGKAFEIMLRNDLHAPCSIDHKFMQEMILLEEESRAFLYAAPPRLPDMRAHELYDFAQSFKGKTDRETIANVLKHTSEIAGSYNTPIEEMRFGGTEKAILERGTDWCADMARVAVVLLDCLGVPCRMLELINPERAYNGHVIVEAYYEGGYGAIDPIYGRQFLSDKPLDAWTLMTEPEHLRAFPDDYRGLFRGIAIHDYDPMDPANDYTESGLNDYCRRTLTTDHHDRWFMGEDE